MIRFFLDLNRFFVNRLLDISNYFFGFLSFCFFVAPYCIAIVLFTPFKFYKSVINGHIISWASFWLYISHCLDSDFLRNFAFLFVFCFDAILLALLAVAL
ncbi:hypothetical protein AADEFJLK_00329 [Methylovulum psychrotolerans]|uniref:Uncharacterized protein n=1 Tax=Methylovulum psychrotolerans TaxID=1704499 RepID=A0A2S5CR63_9GAMM|nr:hypothetical protein AADEFJLK_00329 [Methylovulum psychrotolerans]